MIFFNDLKLGLSFALYAQHCVIILDNFVGQIAGTVK